MDCKAEELRFKVGDTVYANIGEFTEGGILMKATRIEWKSRTRRGQMWVPIDSNDYVIPG